MFFRRTRRKIEEQKAALADQRLDLGAAQRRLEARGPAESMPMAPLLPIPNAKIRALEPSGEPA